MMQTLRKDTLRLALKRQQFEAWLKSSVALAPLIDRAGKELLALDLSVDSLLWTSATDYRELPRFCQIIDDAIGENWGVGGYAEARPFYITPAYQRDTEQGPEWRNVHLGLDIWGAAGTSVFAPLAGTVYSAFDNAGERDYGPTLILAHQFADNATCYTLYGHLDRSAISHWQVGDTVAAGQLIAHFGPMPENGNWPPHLHFQVMLDMLGHQHDFPGVAYASEQDSWLQLCPDPALLLSL